MIESMFLIFGLEFFAGFWNLKRNMGVSLLLLYDIFTVSCFAAKFLPIQDLALPVP